MAFSKGRSVDDKIEPFLPKNWARGPNISTDHVPRTLTHTSGIRLNERRLRRPGIDDSAAGIMLANKVKNFYWNSNFSLMRILIPSGKWYNVFRHQR